MGMQRLDVSRILMDLEAIALAMVSLEETIEYTKQRNVFGWSLASFEGVCFTIVEHVSVSLRPYACFVTRGSGCLTRGNIAQRWQG